MLTLELDGEAYSKAEHRRAVLKQIDRSPGSVEFKLQNVSAVLMELGAVAINGYKPMMNVQNLLRERVEERFTGDTAVRRKMLRAVQAPVAHQVDDLGAAQPVPEVTRLPVRSRFIAKRVDFQAIEASNRTLGEAGELAVVATEQRRLRTVGRPDLADRVEHVAQTRGDGLGYDVLSWTSAGEQRFLEVKTTRSNQFQPFLISRNEVDFSAEEPERFSLVRVYNFASPKVSFYELNGSVSASSDLRPEQFSGIPRLSS